MHGTISKNMLLMRQIFRITIISLATLLLLSAITSIPPSPDTSIQIQYYQHQLQSNFYGDRLDGISGLAHLGSDASEAAESLQQLSQNDRNPFNRMAALWALAEIESPQSRAYLREQVRKEEGDLRQGRFPVVAARIGLLATHDPSESMLRKLNTALPLLYNRARGGKLSERLLAVWALYQISTPVTRETADEAMKEIANELSPEAPDYTVHLRHIRLVGPPAAAFFSGKLASLIENHNFTAGLARPKALTAYTLAAISYPDEPQAVSDFKQQAARRLNEAFSGGAALQDVQALRPFACSEPVISGLKEMAAEYHDPDDVDEAEAVLELCRFSVNSNQ